MADGRNAEINSSEGVNAESMAAKRQVENFQQDPPASGFQAGRGAEVVSANVASRDVNPETADLIGTNITQDDQDPSSFDATATGFGKQVKPAGQYPEDAPAGNMYDPYAGIYVDTRSGHVTSVNDTNINEAAANQHARAGERLEKLEPPACDGSRMSARIRVHGGTTSPFVNSGDEKSTKTGLWNTLNIPNLERVVTTGFTETADVSLDDMAACAFGTVENYSEPLVSIPSIERAGQPGVDITELPTTSTLLHKSHIIPDLLDRVEETGIILEVCFKNVQIFNGMIVDRAVMQEAPSVSLVVDKSAARSRSLSSSFLLLLVELEADGNSEDYLQWMVDRIDDSGEISTGAQVIAEYRQMPFSMKDRHKHVVLLFERSQASKHISTVADGGRFGFNVQDFICFHGLDAAVAAVYFESESLTKLN